MKTKSLFIALSFSFLLLGQTAISQVNFAQFGARMSLVSDGIMARFFTRNSHAAVENILAIEHRNTGFSLTSLYEEHMIIESVRGLSWYAGAGLHFGYKASVPNTMHAPDPDLISYDPRDYDNSRSGYVVGGVDAIIGVDYHIPNTGLHLSADIKPFLNLPNTSATLWDASVKVYVDL